MKAIMLFLLLSLMICLTAIDIGELFTYFINVYDFTEGGAAVSTIFSLVFGGIFAGILHDIWSGK